MHDDVKGFENFFTNTNLKKVKTFFFLKPFQINVLYNHILVELRMQPNFPQSLVSEPRGKRKFLFLKNPNRDKASR